MMTITEQAKRFNGQITYVGLTNIVYLTIEQSMSVLPTEEEKLFLKHAPESTAVLSRECSETWVPGYQEGDEAIYNYLNTGDLEQDKEHYQEIAHSEKHFKAYLSNFDFYWYNEKLGYALVDFDS